MGLSAFQKFAIAGGEAARIVRETESKQMDGIKNALFKSIEDSVAPAAEYRQKHLLVKNKAKEDLQNIINQYIPEDLGLTETERVAAGQALYSKYGYNPDKISEAYQNKVTASQKLGSRGYNTMSFLKDEFQDLKGINSNMDIDTIATIIAQNKVGSAPTGFDTAMGLVKTMPQSRGLVTDPINVDDISEKAKATLGLPKVVEGELPSIPMRPKYEHNKVLDEVQKYRLNESTIEKNKAALDKSNVWKVSDWRNNFKDLANAAREQSNLKYTIIPLPDGTFDFQFPGGEKNIKEKREVERNSIRNFVLGAVNAKKETNTDFIQVVSGVAANAEPLPTPDKKEQFIPGMLYQQGKYKYIYGGQRLGDDGKPKDIIIDIMPNISEN
jgi:hypothetical protein